MVAEILTQKERPPTERCWKQKRCEQDRKPGGAGQRRCRARAGGTREGGLYTHLEDGHTLGLDWLIGSC